MNESSDKMAWKVTVTVAAMGAAWLARNAVEKTWSAVTGNKPPENPESPEVTWAEAVAWALASGVVIELSRLVARRAAAQSWVKRRGALPPGLETAG